MASISSVDLRIFPNVPSVGEALVQVSYTIAATLDDASAERSYRELVQLLSLGRRIGDPSVEHAVPDGTISDGVVVFTGSAVGFVRIPERTLPLADLQQGVSPLQQEPIRARVTLTPLPPAAPSQDSNIVQLSPVVVGNSLRLHRKRRTNKAKR